MTGAEHPAGGPDASGGCPPVRTGPEDVGWLPRDPRPGRWRELLEKRRRKVSTYWLNPIVLLRARNDRVARLVHRFTERRRERWRELLRGRPDVAARFPDLLVRRPEAETAFVVIGDTGDKDASQYAVVGPLLAAGADTRFMVIASDVIYPSGSANDYPDGLYTPYEEYGGTIYAIPGNHDWYDGLDGFMYHFCWLERPPRVDFSVPRDDGPTRREVLRRWLLIQLARVLLWRDRPPDGEVLEPLRRARGEDDAPGPRPVQPGPYFAIDTPALRIVAIDTGIRNRLDGEQAAWLVRASREELVGDQPGAGSSRPPRPKLLITGKPIYVDGAYDPCPMEDRPEAYRTVDDVVRDPAHGYVAVIGGDVHNYQRYRVRLRPGDGRPGREMHYLVSGAGGAHLSPSHLIPRVRLDAGLPAEVEPVDERDFVCRPVRGDSLAVFSRVFAPRLRVVAVVSLAGLAGLGWAGWALADGGAAPTAGAALLWLFAVLFGSILVYVVAVAWAVLLFGGRLGWDEASRYVADLLGEPTHRASAREARPSWIARQRLRALLPPARRRPRLLYGGLYAPLLDHDRPPFFRSFLHCRVRDGVLVISCVGATGYAGDDRDPPVWDCVSIPLPAPPRAGAAPFSHGPAS